MYYNLIIYCSPNNEELCLGRLMTRSVFHILTKCATLSRRIDNGLPLNEETDGSGQSNDGLYEAIVRVKVPKVSLNSPTAINCVLTIPGTNYTKKRETIFYGKFRFRR